MLSHGTRKVREAALDDRVTLHVGEAESLPFDDATFDGVTIAFGIRNVADRPRGLAEMRRVTKPGGRVVVLELSEPDHGLLAQLAKFHIHGVVPFVGGLLSGRREYSYLQASIAAFPPPDKFAQLMRDAGLEVEAVMPQTFGVAHIFVGRVPEAA
jgi:demethylmenaquinone methyltransferase/2-methoxy-6-polyprenyl-1,4-benzoquinol methylase